MATQSVGAAAAAAAQSGGPAATASQVSAFVSRVTESVRSSLSQRRAWTELVDRTAFAKPESMGEATSRIRKNWTYFRVNYLVIICVALALSLLTHPFSLLLLTMLLGGWVFLYILRSEPLLLMGRTYTDREVLGVLAVSTVVVVFLTSVGSLLISAFMAGVGVVCLHGAFRVPEDLFLDEQDSGPAAGFLSFLGGAAAAVQNPVVSHV